MRKAIEEQPWLGSVDIGGDQAEHEIPGRHLGDPDLASAIWNDEATGEEVFRLLDARILPDLRRNTSRPGMHLWRTLVMGELKLKQAWKATTTGSFV